MQTEATTTAQVVIQSEVAGRVDEGGRGSNNGERIRAISQKMSEGMRQKKQREVLEDSRGTLGVTDEQKNNLQARFTDVLSARRTGNQVDAMNRYVKEGYDMLPNAEQVQRQNDVTRALENNPVMGEYMRNLGRSGDPVQVEHAGNIVEGILQDEHLQRLVNKNTQKLAKMEFKPKPKEIQARQRAMDAVGGLAPGTTSDVDATNAMHAEFQATLRRKMNNVVGDSVHEMIRANLDVAEEVIVTNGEVLNASIDEKWMKDEIQVLKDRWKEPNAFKRRRLGMGEDGSVVSDWREFSAGGVDRLPLSAEAKAYLDANPELKQKFEAQVGEALLLKRMRAGQFKQADIINLVDEEWLGPDQNARIDKIQNIMFEQHAGYKSLMSELQAKGISEKDVWDKIKAAGPGIAAGSMLAALFMLFGLPSAAIVGGALKLGAGAAAGGGALYGTAKLRDAA